MPRATDVKFYLHDDQGAPDLTGAAGSITALLHACLVTGYNVTAVDSITRDGTVVTVTISGGHAFRVDQVINISGCDQTEYNGDHRIDSVTATTFTFELPDGSTPASPATGTTIEARVAAAGWERSFVSGDGLRAAFRSTAPDATGFYLYVDDTNAWTRRAGAKGYEQMSDIDTRTDPFPYSQDDSAWVWWYKSDDDTTERPWALFADDKLFYLWINFNSNDGQRIYAFGDIQSYVPAEGFNCLISGHGSSSDNRYCGGLFTITRPGTLVDGTYMARDYMGSVAGPKVGAAGVYVPDTGTSSTYYMLPDVVGGGPCSYPSPHTGGVFLSPLFLFEFQDPLVILRARTTGIYQPLHDRPFEDLNKIDNVLEMEDRKFMAAKVYSSRGVYSSNEYGPVQGQVLIDIVGPWRS